MHGLNLTSEQFWNSTPREVAALRKVWMSSIERAQYMTAAIQATLYNAHFDTGGVPFTAEDLMGTGDRTERKAAAAKGKIESMLMLAEMSQQKPGDTSGLPDWATDLGKAKGLIN